MAIAMAMAMAVAVAVLYWKSYLFDMDMDMDIRDVCFIRMPFSENNSSVTHSEWDSNQFMCESVKNIQENDQHSPWTK